MAVLKRGNLHAADAPSSRGHADCFFCCHAPAAAATATAIACRASPVCKHRSVTAYKQQNCYQLCQMTSDACCLLLVVLFLLGTGRGTATRVVHFRQCWRRGVSFCGQRLRVVLMALAASHRRAISSQSQPARAFVAPRVSMVSKAFL
jgi:hypothetical protein